MSVGFTGTRYGMTDEQRAAVKALLSMRETVDTGCGCCSGGDYFYHGDCIGADSEFHDIVAELGLVERIRIHPPDTPSKRAFKLDPSDWVVSEPKPYLERNRDIVDHGKYGGYVLIATPKVRPKDGDRVTGGTWYTVNYALEQRVPVIVVWPDGAVENLGTK